MFSQCGQFFWCNILWVPDTTLVAWVVQDFDYRKEKPVEIEEPRKKDSRILLRLENIVEIFHENIVNKILYH